MIHQVGGGESNKTLDEKKDSSWDKAQNTQWAKPTPPKRQSPNTQKGKAQMGQAQHMQVTERGKEPTKHCG